MNLLFVESTTFEPLWGYIWSKWMLGCAPDLWSLLALLKRTWFYFGAETPIWSNLKTCTLSPHFKSCWGPSALKPEQDFRRGVRPNPESLTSLPTSWNDVLQLPRLLRLLLPQNRGHYWNIFRRKVNPQSRLHGQQKKGFCSLQFQLDNQPWQGKNKL